MYTYGVVLYRYLKGVPINYKLRSVNMFTEMQVFIGCAGGRGVPLARQAYPSSCKE